MTPARALAALCAAALLVPAAGATAKPGHAGKDAARSAPGKAAAPRTKAQAPKKVKAPKKAKTVTFVFKGTYQGEGAVKLARGNGHVKKYRLAGKTLVLDFSAAQLVVADADGNGVTLDDVKAGDKVLVQVRAPRAFAPGATLAVRKLVDQSRPPLEDAEGGEPEDATTGSAPEEPEAPADIEDSAPEPDSAESTDDA